jgi:hypothetical protein
VECGADPNQAAEGGYTPVFAAAQGVCVEMLRYLIKECGAEVLEGHQAVHDGDLPLFLAAEQDHMDMVRCLVTEFGADVNQTNKEGEMILFDAFRRGGIEGKQFLVRDLGADVNRSNDEGMTPLMVAAWSNKTAIIKHLVHNGAFVRAVTVAGDTAITILRAAHGVSAEQIAHLEVRECCGNPGCDGGGVKRCGLTCARRSNIAVSSVRWRTGACIGWIATPHSPLHR